VEGLPTRGKQIRNLQKQMTRSGSEDLPKVMGERGGRAMVEKYQARKGPFEK